VDPMVFDPRFPITEPPHTLHRPTEAPPPLGPASHLAAVQNLKREFSTQLQIRRSPRLATFRSTARAWAGRVSGRADRRLLFAVTEAVDALVTHFDSLSDRLTATESLCAEVAAAYGEELTRLRAEVLRSNRVAAPPKEDLRG
jgi:hypothetical protein